MDEVKMAKRVVRQEGTTNVKNKNIAKKHIRYLSDLFTTLLDSSWLWLVLMFASSFYMTWVGFAVLYYSFCLVRGDLLEEHLPANQKTNNWTPCILEIDGFAASFLFSLETQHTIGYGSRQTTTKCIEVMTLASVQSILGCLTQAFMVGLVFAKLSRPASRSRTVIFSQNAVVSLRNRRLCLVFRVGDIREDSNILGVNISAKLLRRVNSCEGEPMSQMLPLKINYDSINEPCIFFVLPLEIVHVIDSESPFYRMSAVDLDREEFEIVVVMEGTIETTSMNFQARTSYLPQEIAWGHRFERVVHYSQVKRKFSVDFAGFHSTYEIDTPSCSAQELEGIYARMPKRPLVKSRTFVMPEKRSVEAPAKIGYADMSVMNSWVEHNFTNYNSLKRGYVKPTFKLGLTHSMSRSSMATIEAENHLRQT